MRCVIYQHPLAYLLGIEGAALLRAYAGDYDQRYVAERLDEVRRLLDNEWLAGHDGIAFATADTVTGYRARSAGYDDEGNDLFGIDEPVVYGILDGLPAGVALDAACGTGRYTARLASLGHRVIGVDSSPEMLDRARARVRGAEFHVGQLDHLPMPDGSVDVVTCGLALSYLPSIGPAMAEFARVLRPGGHLVVSDVHHHRVLLGTAFMDADDPAGGPALVPAYRHTTGDFLRAALAVGLQVRRYEEPRHPVRTDLPAATPEAVAADWTEWPWSLSAMVPAAAHAANDRYSLAIWHFQRAVSPPR